MKTSCAYGAKHEFHFVLKIGGAGEILYRLFTLQDFVTIRKD